MGSNATCHRFAWLPPLTLRGGESDLSDRPSSWSKRGCPEGGGVTPVSATRTILCYAIGMLRKRRSLPVKPHVATRVPLKVAHKLPPRHCATSQATEKLETMFESTGNPKHDLILRHAIVRQTVAYHPQASVWMGAVIAACVVLVFFGWWLTSGLNIQAGAEQNPDALFQVVRQNSSSLKQNFHTSKQDIQSRLQVLEAEKAAQAEATQHLTEELRQASVTSTR